MRVHRNRDYATVSVAHLRDDISLQAKGALTMLLLGIPLDVPEEVAMELESHGYLDGDEVYEGTAGLRPRPRRAFVPPTVDEVVAYAESRGGKVDGRRFWEYYDAADWHDARGRSIKSWKQKLITWERRSGVDDVADWDY